MAIKSVFNDEIAEKATALLSGIVEDEAGNPLGSGSLTTLTLTLYDKVSGSIINNRTAQNALNQNGVTVDGSGGLVFTMTPADNPILNDTLEKEVHVALFEWTWSGGAKAGKYEIYLTIKNLAKVL